jgi:hypothetical protein
MHSKCYKSTGNSEMLASRDGRNSNSRNANTVYASATARWKTDAAKGDAAD